VDQGVLNAARQISMERAQKMLEMRHALLIGDVRHVLECAGDLCGLSDEEMAARLARIPVGIGSPSISCG
jgi:hypothetical protein